MHLLLRPNSPAPSSPQIEHGEGHYDTLVHMRSLVRRLPSAASIWIPALLVSCSTQSEPAASEPPLSQEKHRATCTSPTIAVTKSSIGPISLGMAVDQLVALNLDGKPAVFSARFPIEHRPVDLIVNDTYRLLFDEQKRVAIIQWQLEYDRTYCVAINDRNVELTPKRGSARNIGDAIGTCGEFRKGAGASTQVCEAGSLTVVSGMGGVRLDIDGAPLSFLRNKLPPICDVPEDRKPPGDYSMCQNWKNSLEFEATAARSRDSKSAVP